MVMDEAICKIRSRAALCFSHKITEPKALPPQQQPALKARTLSISRLNLPVCCCDKDTAIWKLIVHLLRKKKEEG